MDNDLLDKIYNLQSESKERDSRLESQMQYLSSRMDKTEELLEKMSEILNSQKYLSSVVDQLAIQVGECRTSIETNSRRITELETAPNKKTAEIVNRIIWITIPIMVGAICSGVIFYLKKFVEVVK